MDFMHDTLANGRSIRILTAIDLYNRECIALAAADRFSGIRMAEKTLDHWAYWNGVRLDFSRPGKPADNAFIKSFNASVRRECLSQHWFLNIGDAQRILDAWKQDYNNVRPHSSLDNLPPAHYRAGGHCLPGRNQIQDLRL